MLHERRRRNEHCSTCTDDTPVVAPSIIYNIMKISTGAPEDDLPAAHVEIYRAEGAGYFLICCQPRIHVESTTCSTYVQVHTYM